MPLPQFHRCRVCGEDDFRDALIQYGIRHYAHPLCLASRPVAQFTRPQLERILAAMDAQQKAAQP